MPTRTAASRTRRSLAQVLAAGLVLLAGCGSTDPQTTEETATSGAVAGEALDAQTATRLDDAIAGAMKAESIPGAIVGVWGPAGDYVRTFGVAEKATGSPMQADFYTRVGSVTKTFTVTAMLQLVDQGKLSLDDPISKYVPGVPSGEQITLRNLAQMASGLVTYDAVDEFEDAYLADPSRSFTPQQLLGYVLDKPLQFPPGTQYQYCNTNIVLLGLVVEQQSGQSLPDYLDEHILSPLKLTHTSFPTTPAFPDPHAQGYTSVDGRDRVATDWNPSWGWAAGNMISTLDDMRVWARALATGELLTPQTQRERLESTVPMDPEETASYGLGLFTDGGWTGHSGVIFGYETIVMYLPSAQTTLVVFLNANVPHDVGTRVAEAVTSVISPDHVYR